MQLDADGDVQPFYTGAVPATTGASASGANPEQAVHQQPQSPLPQLQPGAIAAADDEGEGETEAQIAAAVTADQEE